MSKKKKKTVTRELRIFMLWLFHLKENIIPTKFVVLEIVQFYYQEYNGIK